jgi:hypothetical protein
MSSRQHRESAAVTGDVGTAIEIKDPAELQALQRAAVPMSHRRISARGDALPGHSSQGSAIGTGDSPLLRPRTLPPTVLPTHSLSLRSSRMLAGTFPGQPERQRVATLQSPSSTCEGCAAMSPCSWSHCLLPGGNRGLGLIGSKKARSHRTPEHLQRA